LKKPALLFLLLTRLAAGYGQSIDTVKTASQTTGFSRHQSVASYIVPATFIAYGALSFHVSAIDRLDRNISANFSQGHTLFINHADDFLQYSPAIAVYSLNLLGVKGKHTFADRTGAYLLAEGIMAGSTYITKHITDKQRPNGYPYSFPSGHTGTAFVAAEFLSQEYGDVSAWYSVGGYAVATTVAFLRVYNNYHTLSDVVAGAGIGIASAKLSYLIYPCIKQTLFPGKQHKIALLPTYGQGVYGVYIAGAF
jgi:membrane-associated phospholipid phosphatase